MTQLYYQNSIVQLYNTLARSHELNIDHWIQHFGQTIKYLSLTHQEAYLVNYLYQVTIQNAQDKIAVKYFYLIDKLIRNYGNFIPYIQNILVEIYSQVLYCFWQRSLYNSMYQLKILRKLWLKIIRFQILQKMRNRVFQLINLDLEIGFKKSTIDTISEYYKNYLKMTDIQIKKFLPVVTSKDLESRQFFSKNNQNQQREIFQKRKRDYILQEQNTVQKKIRNIQSIMGNSQMVISSTPYNNYFLSQKPINSIDFSTQNIQKSTLNKLNELRKLGNHICGKCGKRFGQKKFYDCHLQQHFLQNKKKYDIKVNKAFNMTQRSQLMTLSSWINSNLDNSQQIQYSIPIKEFDQQEPICKFCSETFKRKMKANDAWIYTNCIYVQEDSINAQKFTMHKDCYDLIQQKEQQS